MNTAWSIADYISTELALDLNVSRNIVNLFEDGHEIPFIARYRRYCTQNASPDDLRHALKAFNDAKALKAKAEKYIKQVNDEVQGSEYQKESLKAAIRRTMDGDELETLIAPFKKARKHTLAAAAAELGVDPLCQRILRGEYVDFADYVDSSKVGLEEHDKVAKAVLDYLSSDIHRREETQKFLREITSNPEKHRVSFIVKSSLTQKGIKLKKDKPAEFKRYELYESVQKKEELLQDHQVLAIHRGCSLGYLKWRVDVKGEVEKQHPALTIPVHYKLMPFLRSIVKDSTQRFLLPSIERIVKKRLFNHAEQSSLDCFASNVRELFLTAPLKGRPVLAIDPGVRHGCKCALVDRYGKLLDTGVLFWQRSRGSDLIFDDASEKKLVSMVQKVPDYHVVIAIGNGKENRSVQKAVSSMIKKNAFASSNVEFCVVSECGSSVYSASDVGIAEFPELDINLRSAVSIARRVLDPISEYVKIPPENLGVGSYQHSINAKRLKEMLDQVVKECVSNVGVDVNVASCQVLEKVAGLNKKTAASIVKFREDNGRISDRKTLQKIRGIGPKTFEQCAGFLYVFNDNHLSPAKKRRRLTEVPNPLDSTPVHPESYHIAEKIVAMVNGDIADVRSDSFRSKLLSFKSHFENGDPEFSLVWELLCKPTLVCNPPKLFKEVFTASSVEPGQIVEGFVISHTQFGSFIDIGIGIDGLLHISRYKSHTPPKVNSRIKVRIETIDMTSKRIGLALCGDA